MTTTECEVVAPVPMRWIGPVRISDGAVTEEVRVPLATYESPLWPSVGRGARVSRQVADGIAVTVIGDCMTRSVTLRAVDARTAATVAEQVRSDLHPWQAIVSSCSAYAQLDSVHTEIVGSLLYLRFSFRTGDASGHNMVTLCAERLIEALLSRFPVTYGSISGNLCVDKKNSSINGILGRGKSVVADILIPEAVVAAQLRTTAGRVAALNTEKNLVGSILAGGVRTANAHYANMLLAFFLATGQDAANIVEGSQGITYAEDRDGDLYFSCSLPTLIVGTVGNGKASGFVSATLEEMGCAPDEAAAPGVGARRLARLCAATVLCGELSLLAAQTNPGELMQSHLSMERKSDS